MDTSTTDESETQDESDASSEPLFSPPGEIRRGAARLVAILALVLVVARFLFWRGTATGSFAAFLLFFLALYTIFGLVQLLFGASISERYQNFWQMSGKQKAIYFCMLLLTLALLWPFCSFLFPGITDKLHRY